MTNDIYYLEDTFTSDNMLYAILFNSTNFINEALTKNEDFISNENISKYYTTREIPNSKTNYQQNNFFTLDDNNNLQKKNNAPEARYFTGLNNSIRRNIFRLLTYNNETNFIQDSSIPPSFEETTDSNNTNSSFAKNKSSNKIIYSYHVNVGHGNCSFVVFNDEIYCIDCSNYDFLNKKSYQENIDSCISYIKSKFKMKDFHINNFILTHPHFDHFSGILSLIKNDYINANTNFYLNIFYSCKSPSFQQTLSAIYKTGCNIIEPITNNSNKDITFFYPDKHIIFSPSTSYQGDTLIQNNINNSSPVFSLNSENGKKFLFTGDIEKEGWEKLTNISFCNLKNKINYYAISHHGSINGHEKSFCPNNKSINSIHDCIHTCLNNNELPLLMARDNAYSGIPNASVLSNFANYVRPNDNKSGVEQQFVEINWNNDKTTWF